MSAALLSGYRVQGMKQTTETAIKLPGLRHPGRWLWLLLLIPVVLGLLRLRFDVEVFDLLPSDLSVVKGLRLYQEHFAKARELIITIKGKTPEQAENAARLLGNRLRERTDLTASVVWEPPWLEHPDQAAELIAYLWFNQPPAAFRQLAKQLAPEKLAETLAGTREELATSMSPQEIGRMSYDPFGFTRLPDGAVEAAPSFGQGQEGFSSEDGRFRIIFVQANNELRTYRDCNEWLSKIRSLVSSTVGSETELAGLSLGYTGRPAFVAEIAGGMEHDVTISVGGTAAIIALLFWLAHKRFRPMLWLLTLLALILGSTLALGGLIFGTINVVSMGFAAILLGLAVDYAVVHYQEALAHPNLTIPQIRHAIAPSIFWAAVTTISAFLVLNLGGLPGLAQLGTLVALGVTLAALIMIFEFLPPLFPKRNERNTDFLECDQQIAREPLSAGTEAIRTTPRSLVRSRVWTRARFALTGLVVIITVAVLTFGLPRIDPTADALRPRRSSAYSAMDEVQTQLARSKEPLWLVTSGKTISGVAQTLERIQSVLTDAVSNHLIAGFTLPSALWPRPGFQDENRATAKQLLAERAIFCEIARTNGFAESALALTQHILNTWQMASESQTVFWPTNPMSRWIFEKLTALTPTNYLALGLITPAGAPDREERHRRLATLQSQLLGTDAWLSGWELLGTSIFSRVKANMWKVLTPMILLVFLSLFLAFRRLPKIFLSLAALLLSALCLLTIMRILGWSWNLLNLMAIPLVLGTGVDYSIFMQLALRRHEGDLNMAYQSVGRALLLCGGTAIAGFGSLAWSTNAGMASLGQVCAVGIGSNMLIAIFLLPDWWQRVTNRGLTDTRPQSLSRPGQFDNVRESRCLEEAEANAEGAWDLSNPTRRRLASPSSLYRAEFWLLGMWIVKLLPERLCHALGHFFAMTYWALAAHRRQVVIENLLPALNGDTKAAERETKTLFKQFAVKIVDLWRYESGLSIGNLFGETTGWEHFTHAQAQKRGILLLTPHLGNWEFGGPLLTQRGITLQVITLAEPGQKFTQLRQASRARWNIETFVIRDDPLAFVEIIHKLEAGATVALLIDRPPAPTAITVELFGRQLPASVAAAELARASGCVLLPVFITRGAANYEAHILPPVTYDRASLRDREARRKLTQKIIALFEPIIHRNLDQWYHFIPIWPNQPKSGPRTPSSTS
jgi:predicted RND superfamily exporter protein/lauroyl/myristoyl acyltransferase